MTAGRLLAVSGALLAASCGCISRRSAGTEDGSPFVCGRSTRAEVLAQWGNPDDIRGDTWVWKGWRSLGGKFKVGYWGVNFTLANSRKVTVEHRLTFDRAGVLASREDVRSLTDPLRWWPFPW